MNSGRDSAVPVLPGLAAFALICAKLLLSNVHAAAPSSKTGRLFLKPILEGHGEGKRFTASLLSD